MDRIANSVPRVTVWHHEAPPSRVMPNSDPRDRIVYPIHKLMLDSFSWILFGASALINHPIFTSAILNKTEVILMFFVTSLKNCVR